MSFWTFKTNLTLNSYLKYWNFNKKLKYKDFETEFYINIYSDNLSYDSQWSTKNVVSVERDKITLPQGKTCLIGIRKFLKIVTADFAQNIYKTKLLISCSYTLSVREGADHKIESACDW